MTQRILVPIDDSDQAKHALRSALEMFSGEEIVVLHVIDRRSFDYAESMLPGGFDRGHRNEIREGIEEQAQDLIDSTLETTAEHDNTVTTVIEKGNPARAISQYAMENDIDHIVIGSHGHSEPTRFWFGSVVDQVVKRAPMSVTIVR